MNNPVCPPESCTVAIVGGGTAGLSLATALKARGVRHVVVLEREPEAGGVPRHCGHYPFGLKEHKKLMKGPDYARANVAKAKAAGVEIYTDTTVTALHEGGRLSLSTAAGNCQIEAERVVLCTGVRETSRAQRFIGGQRPLGVLPTGALQSMVYLHGMRPFRRPVILGTELVSFSAIMTCAHAGIKPVAMIEENARVTVRQIMRPYPALKGVPMVFGARNLRIIGDKQVEAVEYAAPSGALHTIVTDGVIVSGKFRPEAALMRLGHLAVDAGTGGPVVDQYGRASDPAYFCTGNLLRPVETSSWCWHEAVETASRVAQDLANPASLPASVALQATGGALKYVLPQRLAINGPEGAMDDMQIRLSRPAKGMLAATSGGKVLWRKPVSSRPERRILAPLAPLIEAKLQAPVEITLEERG